MSKLAYHRARWMDARVGRFEGTDPLRGSASQHNYVYAGNDPASNIDPSGLQYDMAGLGAEVSISGLQLAEPSLRPIVDDFARSHDPPIEIWMRAFAPWKTFGFGFSGDDRSFTTAMGVTSRISSTLLINSFDFSILDTDAWSSPTMYATPVYTLSSTEHPQMTVDYAGYGSFDIHVSGHNALIPSPDIDMFLNVSLTRPTANRVCFSGSLQGDQFPDVEVFAHDSKVQPLDTSVMMLEYGTAGDRNFGPGRLFGANHGWMGGFANYCIDGI